MGLKPSRRPMNMERGTAHWREQGSVPRKVGPGQQLHLVNSVPGLTVNCVPGSLSRNRHANSPRYNLLGHQRHLSSRRAINDTRAKSQPPTICAFIVVEGSEIKDIYLPMITFEKSKLHETSILASGRVRRSAEDLDGPFL